MKKKRYHLNQNGLNLSRVDIVKYRPLESDILCIDVRALMELTDKELLSFRGVGLETLKQINDMRENLKELFEIKLK